MSDMNVTIYDIAKKCHVSIATVSRVLNGNSRVSEKTRRMVLDTMKDMGYTPNPFARGLGLDSMKIVGVLCTSLTDAFFASAVSLIEDGMRQHHFDIMLSCTGPDTGHNSPYITSLVNKHVDGLITVGTVFPPNRISQFLQRLQKKSRFLQSTVITICPVSIVSSVMKQKACGGSYTPCPDSTAGPSLTCITSGHTAAATNCKGCARG